MGVLVIVVALLLPIVPFVLLRSQVLDHFTGSLERRVFKRAPPLLYTAIWLAAVFGLFAAASATGVGIPAAVAFGISVLVILFLTTNPEDIDVD